MRIDFGEPGGGPIVLVRIRHIVRVHLDLVVIELDVRSVVEETIASRNLPLLI